MFVNSVSPTFLIGLQFFAINILNVTFFQEQTELRPWLSLRVVQDLFLAVEAPTNVCITFMWSYKQEVLLKKEANLFILVDGSVLGVSVLKLPNLKLVIKSGPRLLALDNPSSSVQELPKHQLC